MHAKMHATTTLCFFLWWLSPQSAASEYTEWCRAAPEHGKPEFAICARHGAGTASYTLEIVPAFGPGVELANDVSIRLVGSSGRATPPISIASARSGTHKRITVESVDVGDPEEVQAVLAGSQPWRCQRLVVWKDFRYWLFDCMQTLTSKRREATFTMSGNKMYEATVQTGNDEHAGTVGPIELTMSGSYRQASPKLLLLGVKPGAEERVAFRAADVGELESVLLHNGAEEDPWFCESLRIAAEGGSVAAFAVKRWIGSPFADSVKVSLRPSEDSDSAPQDVECHTRGSDLVSLAPEHLQTFKVRCPMNCTFAEFALTEGASIHPAASSVCSAAEADGVASPSGGVLVVSVVGPLPEYSGLPPPKPGEKPRSFEVWPSPRAASFSFFLYRSDSIDDISSDIRVVDAHGKLAASGRLELRRNGVWGTVCKQGDFAVFTEDSARKACQQIGYLHGMYHEDGCLSLDGHNVCAGPGYPVAAAGVMCLGPEKSFQECTFEEPAAAECSSHKLDVAVKCSNNPPGEPLFGTLRIVDEDGSPSLGGTGRLQVYKDGWGSVCDDGWTKESERVSCMQMGYTGMKNGGISGKSCEDVNGLNMCGPHEEPIHMVNVACEGDEKALRNCPHETKSDIYCAHSEDIVVACRGDGDPTGVGAFKKEDLPEISKRKFRPLLQLSCSDKAASKKGLGGQPGALFLGSCPSGCNEEQTEIRGTFIYTDDSPICKAAIHAGVIGRNGGKIAIVLAHGQNSYFGSARNSISSAAADAHARSFLVTHLVTDVQARSDKEPKPKAAVKYAGDSSLRGTSLRLQQLSLEQNPIQVPPKFQWTPPPDFAGFRGKGGDFVDLRELPGSEGLNGFADFTIALTASVKGGKGKWRTLVSHSGCGGLLLAINKEGEILLENNCDPRVISTGIIPEMDEKFHLAVSFFSPEKRVAIYYNGEQIVSEMTDFDFNMKNSVIIGRAAAADSDYFVGSISGLSIFNYVLSADQIIYLSTQNAAAAAAAAGAAGAAWDLTVGGERRTEDGRVCLSPCSPEEPLEFFGAPEGAPGGAPGGAPRRAPLQGAVELACSDNAWLEAFNGFVGSRFLISCPPNCGGAPGALRGSKVYSPDSAVCKAGLHAGALGPHGGEALLVLLSGGSSYAAAPGHHGLISDAEPSPQIKSFSVIHAPPYKKLSCYSDGALVMQMKVGQLVLISCPPGCLAASDARVYGTEDLYSPLSSVCRAALHAGALPPDGGHAELRAGGPQEAFGASEANGVVSLKGENYLRSFSFKMKKKRRL